MPQANPLLSIPNLEPEVDRNYVEKLRRKIVFGNNGEVLTAHKDNWSGAFEEDNTKSGFVEFRIPRGAVSFEAELTEAGRYENGEKVAGIDCSTVSSVSIDGKVQATDTWLGRFLRFGKQPQSRPIKISIPIGSKILRLESILYQRPSTYQSCEDPKWSDARFDDY